MVVTILLRGLTVPITDQMTVGMFSSNFPRPFLPSLSPNTLLQNRGIKLEGNQKTKKAEGEDPRIMRVFFSVQQTSR